MAQNTYDYIVVGAGSAGSIVASRLSENPQHSVLLLEAGPEDTSLWLKIPIGYAKAYYNPKLNWMYQSTPQEGLAGRSVYCPRGRVVGGSGAINAMIYVRGHAQDFNDWAQACSDVRWSYEQILPVFKRLESHPDAQRNAAYRGDSGPVHITPMHDHVHPLCQRFLAAAQEMGVPLTPDFNGPNMDGAGIYEVNTRKGFRSASHTAFLREARKRTNLTIVCEALAQSLLFASNTTGKPHVQGLRVRILSAINQSEQHDFFARREVIVCAGAVGSPALLERSGIGDGARLSALGIPTVKHLPMVGERLQDHLCASFYLEATEKTLNDDFSSPWGLAKMVVQYVLKRSGPLAMSVNQAGGFFKGRQDLPRANLQLYFNPLSYQIPKDGSHSLQPEPYSGFLIAFNPTRPTSRGAVHITGRDAQDAPAIDPRFLSTQHDRDEVLQGMHLVRRLIHTSALQSVIKREVLPGPEHTSDEAMLAYFRENSGSIYHLCGTCSMGVSESDSVVDSSLRVHGVEGLRVIDASVFPNVTTGNTNAPTMALALRASDIMLG